MARPVRRSWLSAALGLDGFQVFLHFYIGFVLGFAWYQSGVSEFVQSIAVALAGNLATQIFVSGVTVRGAAANANAGMTGTDPVAVASGRVTPIRVPAWTTIAYATLRTVNWWDELIPLAIAATGLASGRLLHTGMANLFDAIVTAYYLLSRPVKFYIPILFH